MAFCAERFRTAVDTFSLTGIRPGNRLPRQGKRAGGGCRGDFEIGPLPGGDSGIADDAPRRFPIICLTFMCVMCRTRQGRRMRQLNYDLKRLQDHRKDGGFVTRRDRSYVFAQAQATDMLHDLGFRRLRTTGLRRNHINALVREWKRQRLSVGTMKNRMAALRWWAEQIGRPGVVGANADHEIGDRRYVTNADKSRRLEPDRLVQVGDGHVRMALRLQVAVGLRREDGLVSDAESPGRPGRGRHGETVD